MESKKKMVVLYPGVGVGHLSPMLELSRGLLRHGGGAVDVVVVLVEPPLGDSGSFADTVARAKAAHTSVAFHVLPSPPPLSSEGEQDGSPVLRMLRFLRATNTPLRDFLRSSEAPVAAVVLDMFCAHALDVAAELGLPAYVLFATGAAALAVFLALPGMRAAVGKRFSDLGDGAVLSFEGAPPLRASELPPAVSDDGAMCEASLRLASRVPEARGILVNSFEALEPRAVRALRDGLCVAPGRAMPPVYCVGPLVSPGGGGGGGDKDGHECLRWLDAQPDRSVVFVCFGSMAVLPKNQLEEIAAGLDSSGQRFLWVVRGDDLDALLPAGFRERTKSRGLVVSSWAPQVDVLCHRAAGAFVTHCGWNSTLEGVMAGLPLLCWPLFAEQGLNKVFVVEEMRLGVEVRRSRDGNVVTADEVEAKVRWVMEESGGGSARALR